MTEPEIPSTKLDTRTREFFQQYPLARATNETKRNCNRHCRKIWLAWNSYKGMYRYPAPHRYARSFERKWGFKSLRYKQLWPLLWDTNFPPYSEPPIGERERALILELIEDVFMMRRYLIGWEIWHHPGVLDSFQDKEFIGVPVPESLAPYGYLKGDKSPFDKYEHTTPIDCTKMSYEQYLKIVDYILKKLYGSSTRDTSPKPVAYFHREGGNPRECAEWIARRFKLNPIPREKK